MDAVASALRAKNAARVPSVTLGICFGMGLGMATACFNSVSGQLMVQHLGTNGYGRASLLCCARESVGVAVAVECVIAAGLAVVDACSCLPMAVLIDGKMQ